MNILKAFKAGFVATREKYLAVFGGQGQPSETALKTLEAGLYAADFGPQWIRETLTLLAHLKGQDPVKVVKNRLYEQLENADGKLSFDTDPPQVVVLLGVNGVGKTTTAAKIAAFLKKSNQKVLLGSCDTFRAAANEQLRLWAERLEIDFVGSQHGSDAAAVAFDSCRAAIARCCDVVILDTAGRLHTKSHLMEELKKLVRVVKRSDERIQPHRWIVIDGSIGTNSLEQAQTFHREIGLTGMVMTKLDGSGRGGAIANIYRQLQIPVYFVGLGENPEDLQPFSARAYVDTLFDTV